ncbi:MAG TPA: spermidine/putrescine ABC transporter substrate-binding protein [Longimicrobiales bacterium]|nr:spermidine/putrescine ABC transporter substrate-binding protein [Longimicrobiales bacterium]
MTQRSSMGDGHLVVPSPDGATGPTRRGFLRSASISVLALGAPSLLTACGTPGARQTPESCPTEDMSDTERVLTFSNWPMYIDESTDMVDGRRTTVIPTLRDFERATGIEVLYNTDINDNAEFFAKVRDQLAACEPTGRDLIVVTDWAASRMVELGWIQKLDRARLPNVEAHLLSRLRSPAWDPGRDFSVPWQGGLTGLAYNAKYTDAVGSVEELLTRSDLRGKVSLPSEISDTMGFMLRIGGADPSHFDDDDFDRALERLREAVAAGQIRRFTGNDFVRDLDAGNVVACVAWSGDIMGLQESNPDIRWVAPEEGMHIWADNMLVPNKATHRANAERLMDYYYEPEVAARVAAWVRYICPVEGAREAMERIDPTLVDNPLIFPDESFLSGTYPFMALSEGTRRRYERAFTQAMGA